HPIGADTPKRSRGRPSKVKTLAVESESVSPALSPAGSTSESVGYSTPATSNAVTPAPSVSTKQTTSQPARSSLVVQIPSLPTGREPVSDEDDDEDKSPRALVHSLREPEEPGSLLHTLLAIQKTMTAPDVKGKGKGKAPVGTKRRFPGSPLSAVVGDSAEEQDDDDEEEPLWNTAPARKKTKITKTPSAAAAPDSEDEIMAAASRRRGRRSSLPTSDEENYSDAFEEDSVLSDGDDVDEGDGLAHPQTEMRRQYRPHSSQKGSTELGNNSRVIIQCC
ncbi:uncharacterized protein PG998_006858, partial [Apiospora kogelbergensis]|uniref:uncharacterized protein n=1 Tax=Apiospora kogelbergensis TaxID=1337665 RepID=UPI00313266E6